MATNFVVTAAELDMFTESFVSEMRTEADKKQARYDQEWYNPALGEVFRDSEGDYWFEKNTCWVMVDRMSHKQINAANGTHWKLLVRHYGPMVYVGDAEDRAWMA